MRLKSIPFQDAFSAWHCLRPPVALGYQPMETIFCHDCEKPVSFSAAACPQCGSIEPRGPYRHSRREIRRHRIEERNDRTLITFMIVLGSIGAFYGAKTGSNWVSEAWFTLLYGFVGVVAAVPIAFAINVTRNWR
jgi:uncharacterized membrane protein YeaQ/YmgE (transglycosylase-associated protein family)